MGEETVVEIDGETKAERTVLTDQAVPPLEFAIYGLEPAWNGERWLESAENDLRSTVWLGHRSLDGGSGILVGTLPRAAFASGVAPLGPDSPGMAIGRLMDVIEPFTMRRSEVGSAVRRHLETLVARIASWPTVPWLVDGTSMKVAVEHFAGGWIAITEDLPESYLVAIGTGIDPGGLKITTTSGDAYGTDFAAALTIAQFRQLPRGRMPQPNQPHPDLLPFLRVNG